MSDRPTPERLAEIRQWASNSANTCGDDEAYELFAEIEALTADNAELKAEVKHLDASRQAINDGLQMALDEADCET